ncbi:cysteine rich repeat-containing protein [Xanthobacter autotrophicus DSM 597]|uniref:cysteine rich repeat-containing protein n=1 Tax=Xanthobacter wiegelii TaxID=3119913 RepID=UPI00372BD80E
MTLPPRAAFLALPLLALCAGPASAQTAATLTADQAQALRTACSADVKKLCGDVQPGGGRVVQCMQAKKEQTTPPCQAALGALSKK